MTPDTSVASILFVYGPLGVGVVIMGLVIKFQNKRIEELNNKINVIQETRIEDARVTRDKIGEQMETNNRVMGLIYDKLYNNTKGA